MLFIYSNNNCSFIYIQCFTLRCCCLDTGSPEPGRLWLTNVRYNRFVVLFSFLDMFVNKCKNGTILSSTNFFIFSCFFIALVYNWLRAVLCDFEVIYVQSVF
jgi:hypothetical protein